MVYFMTHHNSSENGRHPNISWMTVDPLCPLNVHIWPQTACNDALYDSYKPLLLKRDPIRLYIRTSALVTCDRGFSLIAFVTKTGRRWVVPVAGRSCLKARLKFYQYHSCKHSFNQIDNRELLY